MKNKNKFLYFGSLILLLAILISATVNIFNYITYGKIGSFIHNKTNNSDDINDGLLNIYISDEPPVEQYKESPWNIHFIDHYSLSYSIAKYSGESFWSIMEFQKYKENALFQYSNYLLEIFITQVYSVSNNNYIKPDWKTKKEWLHIFRYQKDNGKRVLVSLQKGVSSLRLETQKDNLWENNLYFFLDKSN